MGERDTETSSDQGRITAAFEFAGVPYCTAS